ncbi:prolyl oligopeptidase family serine peptidase [Paludisphaera mucosa]|uniref:Prolyl oligopeptidase family serine peptidase n=1 Tax=Paludisphaera mucosa TaxID=3030827 RepID=A0ABT6FDZ9_9BACT|nr:prolyl oligopeptidase family serine peptidase [Paludisphaera mucosa]MDG3005799.1 prolyl oligopeptidase family serine peptidase [Paludisphaera mucosa]
MKPTTRASILLATLAAALLPSVRARGDEPSYDRKGDVVYGRKYGVALTMDVITPRTGAKGVGVLFMASGGFHSSHDMIQPVFFKPFVDRGYTVFAVVHGSQPRFQVDEIVGDVNRAVRFIRHHAADYHVDPDRLGVYGASAGGHLSLMLGVAGKPGDPEAKDPVDRESSRVQAVACFFPPTDFLHFGGPEKAMVKPTDHQPPFRAAFDYHELDKATMLWVPIADEAKLREKARSISPIDFVTPDDPATLIIHGDADALVPIQQSETFAAKLKEAGVEGKLIVRPGAQHGWPGLDKDLLLFADWFDAHLKPAATPAPAR